MFTPYGYVRNEMATAYVRNLPESEYLGLPAEEDDVADATTHADAATHDTDTADAA